MNSTQVDYQTLSALIREKAGNTIFSATFIKRSTGERRVMICRLGVSKGQAGGKLGYDATSHGLLVVFDLTKRQYRTINLRGLEQLKIRGEVFNAAA